MKVVFLAQAAYSSFGGIQRFNARFIQALMLMRQYDASYSCEVLIRSDVEKDLPLSSSGNATVAFSGAAFSFVWHAIVSVRHAQRIILGHINFLPLAILLKIINPSVSIYMVAHGIEVWGDPEFRKYKWWEPKILCWFVSRILCVSQFSAQKIIDKTSFDERKIIIFPNVIDEQTEGASNLKENRVPNSILTVTRLSSTERKKNIDLVIAAIAELKKSGITATLHIVGSGELLEELCLLAVKLGVDSQVQFHGRVSDTQLQALYRSASIFVLPSEKEGFGIVYLEAWNNGLPVIAARATAIPEVIDDGMDGLLINSIDPLELSIAIATLIKNPSLGHQMVENGLKKLNEKFNHAAFVNRLRIFLGI